MFNVVKTIKFATKKALLRDWDRPGKNRSWIFWLLGLALIIGTVSRWHDFPMNGNPLAWIKADGLYEEALMASKQHDGALALTKLHEAIAAYPDDWRFYAELARQQTHANQLNDALASWQRCLKLNADQPAIWVTVAQLHASLGDLQASNSDVNQVLKTSPANADALAMKALLLLSEDKQAEAEATFAKTQRVNKDDARFWNLAGTYYLRINKMQEAETAFKQCSQMEPTNALYQSALGSFLLMQKRPQEAEFMFNRAAKLDPESDSYWIKLSLAQYSQGKFAEAADSLSHATALRPTDWPLLQRLGKLQMLDKDYRAAAQSFKRVTETQPENASAWDSLIDALVRSNQHAEAKLMLTRFMGLSEKNANNPVAYSYLAQLFEAEGNKEQAEAAFDKAIELSPNQRFTDFCKTKLAAMKAEATAADKKAK